MKNVESRLRRLERAARLSARKVRCATCKDWPSTFLSYENDWRHRRTTSVRSDDASAAENASSSAADPPPDRCCPNCGFRPTRVVVEYVDDWRKVRQSAAEQW